VKCEIGISGAGFQRDRLRSFINSLVVILLSFSSDAGQPVRNRYHTILHPSADTSRLFPIPQGSSQREGVRSRVETDTVSRVLFLRFRPRENLQNFVSFAANTLLLLLLCRYNEFLYVDLYYSCDPVLSIAQT